MADVPPPAGLAVALRATATTTDSNRGLSAAGPAQRNSPVVCAALERLLTAASADDVLLEVAAGRGVHAALCSPCLPLRWMATEYEPDALTDLAEALRGLPRALPPALLDAAAPPSAWPAPPPGGFAAVLAVNVTHIAPLEVTRGLVAGAAALLKPGGVLVIYGPFMIDGAPTTEGNAAFDAGLRGRDPRWGLRDAADVFALGAASGLQREALESVPADNFIMVMRKSA